MPVRRLPLSSAQLRLWFLHQIEDEVGDAYNLSGVLQFTGRLDEAALQRTLDALIARHDVLRATFAQEDGQPVQLIPAQASFALNPVDLRGLAPAAQEAERQRQIDEECGAPFDLRHGPLIRGRLIRLAAERNDLVLTLHHMVSDGWSTAVLMRDVAAFYAAFAEGRPNPLPPLAVQYAEHVAEEQERAASPTRQMRLDHWRRHLDGAPELLELPADRLRPPVQSHAGDRVDMEIPAPLLQALRAWAKGHDATLAMALHAGLTVLLARLSGQDDIVIGTPVANRRRPAYRPLMGFFVNTLALRVGLGDNPTAAALLERVRIVAQAGYLRQDVPFEQLVEALQPTRNKSHSPIFQVMLVMQNFDTEVIPLPGATLQLAEVPTQSVPFDLSVLLRESADGMVGRFAYATALFDRATVERWTRYFVRVLEAMVHDDRQRVGDIALLDAAERTLLLDGFNATRTDAAPDALVHTLFEAHAARTPDAIALVDGERSWRYGELEQQANRLAHRLRGQGVGPDVRVALFVTRGADMVVALLAVLKAGGAYVPLDPADPPERIARMLDDAAPGVVLTLARLEAELPAQGVPVLVLDAPPQATPDLSDTPLDPAAVALQPQHLAYVIYTSGSTGTPKGVAVPHSALVNLIRWQARQRTAATAPRTLQYVALGFDVAFQEIFTTLCGGGTLVLVGEGARRDMAALWRLLAKQRIERLILPFISLKHLAEEAALSGGALPALQQVVTGGEQLRIDGPIRALFERLGDCRLQNQYGPTEYPVATALDLHGAPDRWPALPSIGRPIDNTRVRILDARMQPVPIGVNGDIHLAGAGMARGYLHRPEQSAAAFVPDPFDARPGALLYKSGDVGRWRADGCIDYVSRDDEQVKLRGFRIELGEIEAQLARLPQVADAAVLLREDTPGAARLVAYVAPATGIGEDGVVPALRAHLRSVLPEYMVPAAFVVLPALPLTVNGKIDRRALPAPQGADAAERVMPRNGTEQALWDIWSELLHSTAFGVEDSFFDLGGHSLLTTQVASRVRAGMAVELPLARLFEHVSIAQLARHVERLQAGSATPDLALAIPLERVDRSRPQPLTPAQQRLWFLSRMGTVGASYNMPAAWRLHGALDRQALRQALSAIVERHEMLRTTFAEVDGTAVQQTAAQADFALHEVAFGSWPSPAQREAELQRLIDDEANAPFDLATGPLIRGRLVQLTPDEHVLMLTMHHVISDGWTVGVLMREINSLYAAFSQGRASGLAAREFHYLDYARWQNRWLAQPALQAQLDYWVQRLEGAPQQLELPTDRPRPPVQSHAGDAVRFELEPGLRAAVKALAKQHGVTLYMVLHAGFSILLSRLSGQHDIVIGTPVANRPRVEFEAMVGFFVNTLAVRSDLEGNPTVAALLQRVKRTTLEAYAHQDAPFEQVVEAVRPMRSLDHSPVFQALLTLQETPADAQLALPGLEVQALPLQRHGAPFDLSLMLEERRDGAFGVLEYASDLFDRATVQRWVGHFLKVLAEMARDAAQTIEALPLLGEAERLLLLEGFNATSAEPAPQALVHALFEVQAARSPQAVALMLGERSFSYAQLERQANRLAHHLRRQGVGPDVRVALFVERSPEMVIGLLAVLKAGGAYVPLDPADPPERIARLLQDAAPGVVLTLARLQAELAAPGIPLVVLDADPQALAGLPDTPIDAAAIALQPHHLAYVIYTSGSTGEPKGVAMPHSALANLIGWQRRQQPAAGALRTLQYVALGFDVAFQEIFTTLCAGGTLVMPAEGTRRDMAALWRLLGEQRIERLILPFISLQHLAQEAAVSDAPLPPLRQVVTGGEQVRIGGEIRSLFQRLGTCRLQNQYGPTEYPVATALDLDADPARWPELPTIGRPIDHTRIHILDARRRPVPIGVKGEIFVAGAGMARGYLHRPEQSAAAFVPDPFDAQPGALLYRTGDLGRWRADGNVEFLGRGDDQVKLRGFRIEPAEIEARLTSHPQVRDAAVVLREDRAGSPRLVAYVTLASANDADNPDAADLPDSATVLRAYLRKRLPEHMVPAAFAVLPALPLTVSGKVDRRALPMPADAGLPAARLMPRDATEQALWDIWSEVLDTRAFGVEDSFFELGGHSLMTTQVASRVRQRLGVELALAELFEHPTIAALAQRVARAQRDAEPQAALPIARVPRGRPLPVSLSQRRMWVIQQFDPASAAYNVAVSLRLHGALDVDTLQRAFDVLVERHEGLRTHFAMHEVEPAQFIAAALPQAIERVDLRALPAGERVATARAMLRDRAATPFDLTRAPLQRVTLLRLADDDHALLWLMHHAISDNWSLAILMREMLVVYAALRKGGRAALAPLALEYADYAAWQRSPASVARRSHQMAYWVARLRGLGRLNLPTDFARPAHPSFRGAKVSATLPVRLRESLRRFCGRHGVTPFLVLLAAFKLMLARQAGSTDIAVGTPIANRHHLATEQLVGTLVNTLVMRTDLGGDPSFAELVQRVRSTALEAFEHQDAPFDELVEALGQDRVAQPEGLVRVLFNVPNAPIGRREPVDFSVEEFDLERTSAQFDLSVHVDTEFSHRIHLDYSTDLYAAVTAERMLENYLALVGQVLDEPERALSRYAVVAPAQLALLRDHWNGTQLALAPPAELLVHRHLRTGDAALRDHVAVVDALGQVTRYGELEARANALAHALRARGIGRGQRVGLCVARDAGMLVAQLGVLKSGAAYVPLDPAFPVERLVYMAGDAALAAILVPALLSAPFAATGVALLDPDDPALTAGMPHEAPAPDAALDAGPLDAAYLIYTSGSTGRPKGVAVPHRAVVNFLASMARAPGLLASDRLVAVTTLSFDIAVLELLLPLAVGAQVIVASREQVGDPTQLRTLLERHEATVMQATPSAWRALIDTGWTGGPGFKALIGGEPLPAALAEQLMERSTALWNMYGPTETTVWSTCWQVQSPREGVSIGRPIANTSVWVLDALGHPCPIGVPGEACIGGLGVALGYHERPELTAERFVPDPWSSAPEARMYRTGDLVRWRHDGLLEHLGRLDHQVKVRGFRIELGEIESVLLDHPSVAHCVVVTRAVREDDVRLVAYVALREGPQADLGPLREHLRKLLPEYMVPQHLMALAALPLLPNGKIDRAALPAPDIEASRASGSAFVAPATDEEKAIAQIWSRLLEVDRIAATDNFFDLGGHSLLAMRAVAAIEQQLALQIAPRRLVFETLRQLAYRDNSELKDGSA